MSKASLQGIESLLPYFRLTCDWGVAKLHQTF